jgi:TRAP-type C4-dicarboxylate transport system substrate-binding protein
MPLSEVRGAMQAGRLDALEANVGLVYSLGLYDVLRCMSGNVNLWPFPTVLAMNRAAWDSLTPAERRVLRRAAARVAGASIDILTNPTSTVVADACRDGQGYFFFGDATPGQLRALRGGVQPVYDRYLATEPAGDFIRRIQVMKASMPPPPAPPPYPRGCGAG